MTIPCVRSLFQLPHKDMVIFTSNKILLNVHSVVPSERISIFLHSNPIKKCHRISSNPMALFIFLQSQSPYFIYNSPLTNDSYCCYVIYYSAGASQKQIPVIVGLPLNAKLIHGVASFTITPPSFNLIALPLKSSRLISRISLNDGVPAVPN